MNGYRLPAHLLGFLFLVVATADSSRAPITAQQAAAFRSLAESGITETYRWGSLGPDPHVELLLTSPLFGTRGAEGTVVIKARTRRWWNDGELWISQGEVEAWQAEVEAWYGEFNEKAQLAMLFSRGEPNTHGLPDLGMNDHYEVYRNGQRMGELPHPGRSSDLEGVCSDPVSNGLRFFRLGWSGSASDPPALSVFYFTENDELREEVLMNFEGANVSDLVDCSSAEARPGPCPCNGLAASSP